MSLFEEFPNLIEEWDYQKNKVSPTNIHCGSAKKVWWKCKKCGFSWETAIRYRTKRNGGCPVCSGKRCGTGINDLQTLYPEISKEFYEEKNECKACEVAAHTAKKYWWICSICGKEYYTSVSNRTGKNKTNCPYCRKEKHTSFPEQCIYYYIKQCFPNAINSYKIKSCTEIDIFIPELNIGIEYDGVAWHKNIQKDEKKDQLCIEKNIMLIRIREKGLPELKTSCCYFVTPNEIKELETTITFIIKEKLHITAPQNIDIQRDYIEIYSQYITLKREKSLACLNPELIEEWDFERNGNLTPEKVTTGSGIKVWWNCKKCGLKFQAVIYDRARCQYGCPKCSREVAHEKYMQQVLKKAKTLQEEFPEIAKEWNYERNKKLTPDTVASRSSQKVWWCCQKYHHEFQTIISNRTTKGVNCPYCSNKRVLTGFNDLATTNPELLEEWDWEKNSKITPYSVTAGSGKKVWWKCKKCEFSWQSIIADRKKQGCPYCVNKKVKAGFNDLATTNPELLEEWDFQKNNLLPTEVTFGSRKLVWWLCRIGHSYQKVISKKKKDNCPYCNNQIVLKGFNDLQTKCPEIALDWNQERNKEITPDNILFCSSKKVWWKCQCCGYEWQADLYRRIHGSGCQKCSVQKRVQTRKENLPFEKTLAYRFPEIAKEWNFEKNIDTIPEKVSFGSDKKVWWTCSICHYEWIATIGSRTRGTGCPVCGKAKANNSKKKKL